MWFFFLSSADLLTRGKTHGLPRRFGSGTPTSSPIKPGPKRRVRTLLIFKLLLLSKFFRRQGAQPQSPCRKRQHGSGCVSPSIIHLYHLPSTLNLSVMHCTISGTCCRRVTVDRAFFAALCTPAERPRPPSADFVLTKVGHNLLTAIMRRG